MTVSFLFDRPSQHTQAKRKPVKEEVKRPAKKRKTTPSSTPSKKPKKTMKMIVSGDAAGNFLRSNSLF